MINFKKRLNSSNEKKSDNPIEIYSSLDRHADKGRLRPPQEKILAEWYSERREDKDVIVKLHTGEGKTLIGLLMLQSFLNSGEGPVMYVCPDRYLVDQTCAQASEFGIDYVKIDDGDIPNEFYDSKSILIVHVQKVFNGRSKFGIGNKGVDVGAVVLDDSHACIGSIEDSSNLKIGRGGELYDAMLSLFEDYLKAQGVATFKEVKGGKSYDIIDVPYWAWREKSEQVIDLLIGHEDEVDIFPWILIKDEIEYCRCYISSYSIEIYPIRTPIYKYKFFDKAKHRILMSATTNNDASFIKGLGIGKESILKPLINMESLWSGEKMILVPFYIDPDLSRSVIVSWLGEERPNRNYGVVALTPSNKDAEYWESQGALRATSSNMFGLVQDLKDGHRSNTVVFSNRYDGIDLPDRSCRILVLDERPYAQNLYDGYQEEVRGNSDLINIKIAQKIEQGLGRGVRGEKDYCIILLNGTRLIGAIKDRKLREFFSPQTRKQVEIGLQLTEFAIQDSEDNDGMKILKGVMRQCLQRDDDWKAFYKEQMDEIERKDKSVEILEKLEIEHKAENFYGQGEYSKAKSEYQKLIDQFDVEDSDRGWYLQEMARSIYPLNVTDSNQLQASAYKKNRYLLKPSSGVEFVRLKVKESRSNSIKQWIESFSSYTDLKIALDSILSGLIFGPNYKEFEKSLDKLGEILGFESEQPELEWKEGPDNLWCVGPNQFIIIECKSGVSTERNAIIKSEAEQLLHSVEWFKKNYPKCAFTPLMVIPTKTMEKGVHLSIEAKILRRGKLNNFKKRVNEFFGSFKASDFERISIDLISERLNNYKLTVEAIIENLEDPYYFKK